MKVLEAFMAEGLTQEEAQLFIDAGIDTEAAIANTIILFQGVLDRVRGTLPFQGVELHELFVRINQRDDRSEAAAQEWDRRVGNRPTMIVSQSTGLLWTGSVTEAIKVMAGENLPSLYPAQVRMTAMDWLEKYK